MAYISAQLPARVNILPYVTSLRKIKTPNLKQFLLNAYRSSTAINTNSFKALSVLRSPCPLEFVSLIPLENKLHEDRDLDSHMLIQTPRIQSKPETSKKPHKFVLNKQLYLWSNEYVE